MPVVLPDPVELSASEMYIVAGGGNAYGHDKNNNNLQNVHIKIISDPVTNIYQTVIVDNSVGLSVA